MGAPAIKLDNITYKYPMGSLIVKNSFLEIHKGEFVILLGSNGKGKSTLLRLIMGLRTPVEGNISVLGLNPQVDHDDLVKRVAYLSQATRIPEELSIGEYLEFVSVLSKEFDIEKANKLLKSFELDSSQIIRTMSTGEKNRASIVAGLSRNPEVLIVDEMTAVLDPIGREVLHSQIQKENEEGKTVVLATNIPEDVKEYADKVIYLGKEGLQDITSKNYLEFYRNADE